MSGARRDNAGKPDLSLLPYTFEVAVARVMEKGAAVYGRDNYRNGHTATNIVGSMKRHIGKFLSGEDMDTDSGEPHLAHIAANCLMALEQIRLGTFKDDRWKGEAAPVLPLPTGAPPADRVFQIFVKGQSGRIIVGTYLTREEAEKMIPFHRKHWPAPNFVLGVQEEIYEPAQTA